jgi:hypothetical protein
MGLPRRAPGGVLFKHRNENQASPALFKVLTDNLSPVAKETDRRRIGIDRPVSDSSRCLAPYSCDPSARTDRHRRCNCHPADARGHRADDAGQAALERLRKRSFAPQAKLTP